jgi:hypothetical protein
MLERRNACFGLEIALLMFATLLVRDPLFRTCRVVFEIDLSTTDDRRMIKISGSRHTAIALYQPVAWHSTWHGQCVHHKRILHELAHHTCKLHDDS